MKYNTNHYERSGIFASNFDISVMKTINFLDLFLETLRFHLLTLGKYTN